MEYTKVNYEESKKMAETLVKGRNRAMSLIDDAVARYVKEKTRARSKKAAMERDAALSSPRFNCLAEYERRSDIVEAYGWDSISASECDRLEALWDEREAIQKQTDDNGQYHDAVTQALHEAYGFVAGLWEKEITENRSFVKSYEEEVAKLKQARREW